jgi:mono/diheme cytochrome c family protein
MALVFWAGAYLAFNSGGFQSDVYNPTQVSWTGGGAAAKGPPDPMVVGKRLFTANCVACHQATGQGVAGQFPTLVGSEWVLGGDWHGDNHLVKILLHGLQGPIQVKGNTYNGAMPPWKQLKDDQIAMILTYIRNEWGNSAPPITAEQVAKVREETAAQTEPYTQNQLKAIPAVKYDTAPAAAPAEGEAVPPAPAEAPPTTPAAA